MHQRAGELIEQVLIKPWRYVIDRCRHLLPGDETGTEPFRRHQRQYLRLMKYKSFLLAFDLGRGNGGLATTGALSWSIPADRDPPFLLGVKGQFELDQRRTETPFCASIHQSARASVYTPISPPPHRGRGSTGHRPDLPARRATRRRRHVLSSPMSTSRADAVDVDDLSPLPCRPGRRRLGKDDESTRKDK